MGEPGDTDQRAGGPTVAVLPNGRVSERGDELVDVEDEDVAEITVSAPLLKRYKQNLAAYRSAMHEWCTRRGVMYLFTSNQVPFDKLVLSYLRQRGLVR